MDKVSHSIGEVMAFAFEVGTQYCVHWPESDLEWFDHRYDWARGPVNWMWMERGIFGMKCINEGDRVLDLFCGDGIFTGLMYSSRARHVDGIDSDSEVIALAKQLYSRPNVTFYNIDGIKKSFPSEHYDVVTFFEGIEHLSVEDGNSLLSKIADCLLGSDNGTLIGSTPLGDNTNPGHQNEFTSMEEVRKFLIPYFNYIELWSSVWNTGRTEVYFICR